MSDGPKTREEAERIANEKTTERFSHRLASQDQRNGYEVGYFEALLDQWGLPRGY